MSSAMLCRVCLKEEDGYVSLLNLYYENIPVSLFIKDIFNLKMEHDSSSLVICNMCNHVMKNFYDFYKMVKEAHNNYERLHYRGREFDISLNMECTENEGDPYNDNFEINPYMSKPDSGVKKRQEDKIIIPKSVIKREYEASLISDKNFMRPIVALEETNVDTVDPPSVAMPDPVDDPLSDHQEQEVPKSKPKKSRMNTAKAKAATKKLLLEYKPEEMYHEGHWLFTEDQMNYVFSLYVELKCTKCALPVFSNLKDLESHSQSEHDCSPVLYCCQYGTANRDRLKRHILFRHVLNCAPPRVFPTAICPICKKVVRCINMKNHLTSHVPHEKRKFQCDICHSGFPTAGGLNGHLKSRHPKYKIPCKECGKTFQTNKYIKEHMRRVHSQTYDMHNCPVCGKEFKSLEGVKYHVGKKHGGGEGGRKKKRRRLKMEGGGEEGVERVQEEVKCYVCNETYDNEDLLNEHIKAKHPSNKITCHGCGKRFQTTSKLQSCPVCGKEFKTIDGVMYCASEPIVLPIQTDRPDTEAELSEKVKCYICGAVLKRASVVGHMKVHNPKNHIQCPHCKYKGFNIKEHIKRVHDKIKKFTCIYCPMRFHKKIPMEEHIASCHTRIPRYACEFCDKQFMYSSQYHMHLKKKHPEQLAEKRKQQTEARKREAMSVPLVTGQKYKAIRDLDTGNIIRDQMAA